MTENPIQQALARRFERTRIVFWYDDKKEFRELFRPDQATIWLNVVYPLAGERIEVDLDDGVKHNDPLFGEALKTIPGLSES